MSNKRKGQGLLEFALVLPVMLMAFCVIIESGRIFHAYTTVQHAAREGARYAVTGQEEASPGLDRVQSIKHVARGQTGSLMVDPDRYWDQGEGAPYYDDTGALIIRVWGRTGEDDAGGPGDWVRVRVVHNMPVITPLLMPIAKYVRVTGEAEMINEGFGTGVGGGGHEGVMPPTLLPLPTEGVSPIPPNAFVLTVEADKTRIHSGDTVEFTYHVTNNTGSDLTGVEVSDRWDNPVPGCTMDIPADATGSCTTSHAIDATDTYDVSASCSPFSSHDSITITVIEPELTLTARPWEFIVFRNDVLTFTYTVENTGVDAPLTNVYVVDSLGGDTSATAQDLNLTGDTVIWEVAHVMDTPGTIVVNVTATGTDELATPAPDYKTVIIEVLDLDPIKISEPLMAGQTVVTGTAHAGRTVFIYDPQDSRVSGAATVNGAGEFSFAGLPPLIAGHTIVVNGYGAYDSARVQGELAPIVITTDPLCHGTTTIAGTAQPGETVHLSIPDIGYSDSTKVNVDTGQFQFALYGGATFQYGQTVVVSGYDAVPATKDVEWCGGEGEAFIVIAPQCAPAGATTTVRVSGYNWAYQNQNDDVEITWESGSATYEVPATPPEPWVKQFEISTPPGEGTYTIVAANRQRSASTEFAFPCPAPNLVVTNLELVTSLPISTYHPIEFRVTVANIGTMPVNSLFWVDLYEPTLPPVGTSGFAWGAVSNLAPGASIDVTVNYVSGFETTGNHTIHARVDSMATVDETDEEDNDFTDFVVPVTLTGTPPGPTPGNGQIEGYVLNSVSGAGADRARVWCQDQDTGVVVAETYADPEGYFVLTDLPPGTYLLYAERWIGSDYYFGSLPTPIIIVGDDVVGPVIFFIRRQ